jgi:hypothetical protein
MLQIDAGTIYVRQQLLKNIKGMVQRKLAGVESGINC